MNLTTLADPRGVWVPCADGVLRRIEDRRQRTSDRRVADPDRYRCLRLRGGSPSDKRAMCGPFDRRR